MGDARFNNYILEHGHKYLIGDVHKYWDAPFMYPYHNVIALSDNLLGTVPIYSMFRIFGQDRESAFQFWLLSLFLLNYIFCYWVLKKWSGNSILSATGAYIFAFSIFILGHITNVQVFPRFMVPLIFYWSWEYLQQKQLKYFLLLMLGIVYQFYCGIYLGFFLLYTLLFLLIAYISVYRDWELFNQFRKIKTLSYHVAVILLACILSAPLMMPYIEIAHTLGMRTFEDAYSSIPTWRSYFFTSKAPILWASLLSEHGMSLKDWWCHFLFMGALPWLGVLILPFILLSKKIEREKRKFIGFLSLGLFLSFIFCLNIRGITLYKIIFQLPGFSSMRSINRVINTEVMFFILIFVFVFNEIQKYSRAAKMMLLSFPFLIVADNLINPEEVKRYDKSESQKQIDVLKEKIKNQYDKNYTAIAYVPSVLKENVITHLNVMLAAQELNIPCVNAYSGAHPGNYSSFFDNVNYDGLRKWSESSHLDMSRLQIINDFGKRERGRSRIHLQAMNGMYACADKTIEDRIIANRGDAYQWETFTLILFDSSKCAIRAYDDRFLCEELGSGEEITATRPTVLGWETFKLVWLDKEHAAFIGVNGKYITVDEKSFRLFARSTSIGKNETFKVIEVKKE